MQVFKVGSIVRICPRQVLDQIQNLAPKIVDEMFNAAGTLVQVTWVEEIDPSSRRGKETGGAMYRLYSLEDLSYAVDGFYWPHTALRKRCHNRVNQLELSFGGDLSA